MSEGFLSPLFTWRSAVASDEGQLPSSSRLVALVLSLHMNERGGSCFPSLATLTSETGLSKHTVIAQLAHLEGAGWLRVDRPQAQLTGAGPGRGRSNNYTATIPVDNLQIKGAVSSPFSEIKGAVKVQSDPLKGAMVEPEDVEDVSKESLKTSKSQKPVDNRTWAQKESDRRLGGEGARFLETTPEYIAEVEAKAEPPGIEVPKVVRPEEAARARSLIQASLKL